MTTIEKVVRAAAAVLAVALVSAGDAAAQSVTTVLTFLTTNQTVETGNFARDRAAAQATSDTISRALVANLATLPVTSSSGAFVYRLNAELGTVERASQTFGPFFVQRALTLGRSTAAVGMTFQHLRFTSLGGHALRDGTFVTTANKFFDEAAPFDVDQLRLDIDADVATLYGSIGIGNRVELGVAAPMTMLRLGGERVNTYRGRPFTQAKASATAVGLADVLVRSKYSLLVSRGAGLAAAVDLRLPTGRREDLLGTGTLSLRLRGIGSFEGRRVSSYANAGVGLGGLAREVEYGGAVAVATAPRISITGELLGRWIASPGGIVQIAAPHPSLAGVQTIRLAPDASRLHSILVVPGVKWNVADTWVLVCNAAVPLTRAGLTSPMTPFIGLDYSITR